MVKSIVFTIDNLNYKGGAHVATINLIKHLLTLNSIKISIITLEKPDKRIIELLKNVQIFTIDEYYLTGNKKNILSRYINKDDTVSVPFENSLFRKSVSQVICQRKIQWIHVDYEVWRNISPDTRRISADDAQIYKCFDVIIFVSIKGFNGFINIFPELKDKCIICRNIFDIEKIYENINIETNINIFSSNENTLKFITVARLDTIQKGIDRCLIIAKRLKEQNYSFEWVFAGNGEEDTVKMLHNMTKELGLQKEIKWVGHTDNPHILIKEADVFCLFSYYEGIANTIYESLIIGTPVIATNVSGAFEQLENKYGWIVDNDENHILNGMIHLFDNKESILTKKGILRNYRYDNRIIQERLFSIIEGNIPFANITINDYKPLISIIVPVYNVQDYIAECLESLVNQTLKYIEIIVVNDGSLDKSCDIVDEYAQKFPKLLKRYDKPNGGLGDARNYGLQYANCDYVAFIDSDDHVEPNMFELMYKAAINSDCDIVQCDLRGFDNETGYTEIERTPFIREGIVDDKELMLYSTRPVVVSACTKLYKKEIFNNFKFPMGWYEDMGVIPIIFSYIKSVYYLPLPLYVYRWNRQGSIQSQKDDLKTLSIFTSKQRILDSGNEIYKFELTASVYDHCNRFYKQFKQYKNETKDFICRNANYFSNNHYINQRIIDKEYEDLLPIEYKIPKVIHYCWFGGNPKSDKIIRCMESWKKHLPDWEIKEWNETNCDIASSIFADSAYKQKKWAYVADYFRFKVLYEHGGFYLDTDMFLNKPLDNFLRYNAVFSMECYEWVSGGVVGSIPKNLIFKKILEQYNKEYNPNDGTICHKITKFLLNEYNYKQTGNTQILKDDIAVFSPNIFIINVDDGKNYCEHLYDPIISWQDENIQYKNGETWKYIVLQKYFKNINNVHDIAYNNHNYDLANDVYKLKQIFGGKRLLLQIIKEILKNKMPWIVKLYKRINLNVNNYN